jgi:hypothetical protein
MMAVVSRWLLGHPLATAQAVHARLTKTVALAVFSSDALSSVVLSKECSLAMAASQSIAHRERSHEVFEQKHDMECTTSVSKPRFQSRRWPQYTQMTDVLGNLP